MKILVTGSNGFVGAALCQRLLALGHEVYAFHRSTSNLKMLEGLPVQHVLGDLTQPETLHAAAQGMEVIFHTAASLGGGDKPARMYAITVEGTRALLAAAKDAGVRRVVHTSSVAALGIPEGSSPNLLLDENHTWNAAPDVYPYGYAKYLAELEVQKAVAAGLDVVIVNPTAVFGAGDLYRQASSVIVHFAHGHLPITVRGGINVVHLQDVVDGHLAALERGQSGQRYILGGWNLTHTEFLRRLAEIAQVPPPVMELPVGLVRAAATPLGWLDTFLDLPLESHQFRFAGKFFYYRCTKAQTELGLPEPRPAEDALREAYDWFAEVGAVKPRPRYAEKYKSADTPDINSESEPARSSPDE